MIDRLIDWVIDRLIDWVIDRLIDVLKSKNRFVSVLQKS